MIESKNNTSKNLEKALQALRQAQQRAANEKKKQNEKKRKAEKPLSHPMRPLTENGEWAAKQKKVYDLDENGEKIPVIDKRQVSRK